MSSLKSDQLTKKTSTTFPIEMTDGASRTAREKKFQEQRYTRQFMESLCSDELLV